VRTQNSAFEPLYTKADIPQNGHLVSFQDRLGTGIGTVERKKGVLCAGHTRRADLGRQAQPEDGRAPRDGAL